MNNSSYKLCCNYGSCWNERDEAEPCWGVTEAIDEEYTEDDYWWIHGCQGHLEYFGKYIQEPNVNIRKVL